MSEVKLYRTHPSAVLPTCKVGDVGWDLSSIEGYTIMPGATARVSTGWRLAGELRADEHGVTFLKIEGRSGLALQGVFPVGGIIDPGYRGPIDVILHNSSPVPHIVMKGDRVAQLVLYRCLAPTHSNLVFFTEANDVTQTERGEKGFGSSGR